MAGALVKAISAARLYPVDNPTHLKAKQRLDDALDALLTLTRSIRLVVGRHTLFYGADPVLDEEHGDSVASCLHKDGIREITFHHGLTPEETADLLQLFTRSGTEAQDDTEDIRTLLWERSFDHISCVVIDDFLDMESGAAEIPDEFGEDFIPQIDLESYELEDEKAVEQSAREMSERVLAKLSENDVSLFGVSEEERSQLLAELEAEEDPKRMRQDFARILVEVLRAETDPDELKPLLKVFVGHMHTLLEEGNLLDLTWLLKVLVRFRAEHTEMPETMSAEVEQAIGWLWEEGPRELLRKRLDEGNMDALQGLPTLVADTPDDAIRHLCLLLGDLEAGRVRRRLIDLLVERCRASWTAIVPLLGDSRWYLVRNITLILGQVGNRLIAPSLHRVLRHKDHRVRKEALIALDRLDPGRAISDLKDALGDEERRIRIVAAQLLAKRGRSAAPEIVAVATNKEFAGRSEDELLAIYTALAHAGGDEAFRHLATSTKPRGLFRKGPTDEMRAAACRALGHLKDPDPSGLIRMLLKDKSELVRESARKAIEEAKPKDDPIRDSDPEHNVATRPRSMKREAA